MTFNALFQAITQNLFFGGVAASILLFLMFRKATAVAQSGDKAKMATWAMAPSMMILASVIMTGAAVGIALPRLQALFLSAPAQNTLAVGNALTAALDNFLFTDPSAGLVNNAPIFQPQTQQAVAPVSAPPVNVGQTATFTNQPVKPSQAAEVRITTNEQAVAAVQALEVKNDAQTYINTFIADNTPADATIACGGSYTIKSGDSLAKIAKACYGDSNKWVAICRANRLADCNNVRAGIALVIPSDGTAPTNSAIAGNQTATVPASWGQQATTYTQPAQQAAAPVRSLASGEVTITSNEQAVAAIQSLAPAVQPTPRAAYVLAEVLGKPSDNTGLDYINKFLAENANNTVAHPGN